MTWKNKPSSVLRDFGVLLQPFAPDLAESLWRKLSKLGTAETSENLDNERRTLDLGYQPWPKFDPKWLIEDALEIPVQVNGKLRDVIKVPTSATQADLEAAAKSAEKVKPFIDGKTIKKTIIVPGKLVNIVLNSV